MLERESEPKTKQVPDLSPKALTALQMKPAFLFLLLLLLLLGRSPAATAQPGSFSSYGPTPAQFNSSMAIIVVVLISVFFLMGFLSIYLRHCADPEQAPPAGPAAHRRGATAGLSPAAIDCFPKLVYADVKQHKLGKGALECAVCLTEFSDGDELRLLPTCDHVFHPTCIATWLSSHATCPVCRADLSAPLPPPPPELSPPPPPPRLSRSNSTGHSLVVVHVADDVDRFTLRLPDHVRRDVIAGKLRRSNSFGGAAGPATERWSFFSVVLSALSPRRESADVAGLSADGKGDRTVRNRFDCLGGGGGGGAADLEEGSPCRKK